MSPCPNFYLWGLVWVPIWSATASSPDPWSLCSPWLPFPHNLMPGKTPSTLLSPLVPKCQPHQDFLHCRGEKQLTPSFLTFIISTLYFDHRSITICLYNGKHYLSIYLPTRLEGFWGQGQRPSCLPLLSQFCYALSIADIQSAHQLILDFFNWLRKHCRYGKC